MKIAIAICIIVSSSGCANLMRAFVPDSPRPNADQLKTTLQLSKENVTTIAGLQINKQNQMGNVARSALHNLKTVSTAEQTEAITNIAANAFQAIERADGTGKTLGKLQGETMEDVLRMPTSQFLAGIAAQTVANVNNQESVYSGIKTGWQWTKTNIGGIAGIATLLLSGGVGVKVLKTTQGVAAASQNIADQRSDLLQGQAAAMEKWKGEHPEHRPAWESLKSYLFAIHSQTPLNVKEELNI